MLLYYIIKSKYYSHQIIAVIRVQCQYFQSLNHHLLLLLDQTPFQLHPEKNGERGRRWDVYSSGGNYFKYFGQRGSDYSMEEINRGMAIARRN